MTLAELKTLLKTTGLPVTYRAWPEKCSPQLPFICYLCTGSTNLYADGSVYSQSVDVAVELYTQMKDPETEAKVETVLQGFHWKKTETYIDTERCYQILYEIEV